MNRREFLTRSLRLSAAAGVAPGLAPVRSAAAPVAPQRRVGPARGLLRVCAANPRYSLFDSPADWISPNPDGGYRDKPPVADGRKVILNDTDHLWGLGGDAAWVWKSFLRGMNVLFTDPYDGLVLRQQPESKWEAIRRNLGSTRRYAERVDLTAMTPQPDLASTGWCLAHAAEKQAEYLVFAPDPGRVIVDLAATHRRLGAEWFNPAEGRTTPAPPVEGGGRVELAAPFTGDAVVYLSGR